MKKLTKVNEFAYPLLFAIARYAVDNRKTKEIEEALGMKHGIFNRALSHS